MNARFKYGDGLIEGRIINRFLFMVQIQFDIFTSGDGFTYQVGRKWLPMWKVYIDLV